MWDSFNGTLLPSGFGGNSNNISFGISPMMGMGMGMGANGMMPPVPYSGYGMPMFPGGMAGLPYDTCSFSTPQNLPPLKTHGQSFWHEIPTALKVIGGGILAIAAFKFLKGKKPPKITSKAKP